MKHNKAEEKRAEEDAKQRELRMQRYDAHMNQHGHYSMRPRTPPTRPPLEQL